MSNNYDLSKFIKGEKQIRKPSTIKLPDGKTYKLNINAWNLLEMNMINEKYGNKPEKLGPEIVKVYLGKEALKVLEDLGDSVEAEEVRLQVITIIISEITGITQEIRSTDELLKKK